MKIEGKKEFEKLRTDDFVLATIEKVDDDPNYVFEAWDDSKEDYTGPAVRLTFQVEGAKGKHQTKWMAASSSGRL